MKWHRYARLLGSVCMVVVLVSGCEESAAPDASQPATVAGVGSDGGSTVVADAGCTLAPPFVLDDWLGVGGKQALVVEAEVLSADPPEVASTPFGDYVVQRLSIDDVDAIVSTAGAAPDIAVALRPSGSPGGTPGSITADDLVAAHRAILIGTMDALVAGAAAVEADGSVHFFGRCDAALNEALETIMEQLDDADRRSERDVLVDRIREYHGVSP